MTPQFIKESITAETKKAFIAALIGGGMAIIPNAVLLGEYKARIENMEQNVSNHLNSQEPRAERELQKTITRVAVLESEKVALQKALDDIKRQNEQILARLPQYPLSRR